MKVLNNLLWNNDLKIYQDNQKFVFSTDSIILAKFVTISRNTKNILDVGTGNAPIPLILSRRSKAIITGVEIQEYSYKLGLDSIRINNLESRIKLINGDITIVYKDLPRSFYDILVCNPPYFKKDTLLSRNEDKAIARSEITLTLDDIFRVCKRVLKENGTVAIVNRPERLADIINTMKKYSIEPKRIQFVYPKMDKAAKQILIEGTKNGKPGLKVLKPLIMHNDDNSYSNDIVNIFN